MQKANAGDSYLATLFNVTPSAAVSELFKNILKENKINTYYFDRENDYVQVKDISCSIAAVGNLSRTQQLSVFTYKAFLSKDDRFKKLLRDLKTDGRNRIECVAKISYVWKRRMLNPS